MATAHLWALRSTCQRLAVGAVLARDGRGIGTGYNGARAGYEHCQHTGEELTDPAKSCTRAVHAERNALTYARRRGHTTDGTDMFCTHAPCQHCAPYIIRAGVHTVTYAREFRSSAGLAMLRDAGLVVTHAPFDPAPLAALTLEYAAPTDTS